MISSIKKNKHTYKNKFNIFINNWNSLPLKMVSLPVKTPPSKNKSIFSSTESKNLNLSSWMPINPSQNSKANKNNKNNKNSSSKISFSKMPKSMSHKWKKNISRQPKNSSKKINLSTSISVFIKKKNKFSSNSKKLLKKLNPKSIES